MKNSSKKGALEMKRRLAKYLKQTKGNGQTKSGSERPDVNRALHCHVVPQDRVLNWKMKKWMILKNEKAKNEKLLR